MALSFNFDAGFTFHKQWDSEWDDDILERTARALFCWRRPKQSWYCDFHQLDKFSTNWFYEWADEFLTAAMPDGADAEEWSSEDAAKVYYRMSHDGCMYSGMEELRWPQVGHWYERVADSVMNAALHDNPVDNSHVLPMELR